MSNVIKVSENNTEIEVYKSKILSVFDEYVNNLENENDIYDVFAFTGAMKYIYKNIFYTSKGQHYNLKTKISTDNIELLEHLWDIYSELCYKYKQFPTVGKFALMIGVSKETMCRWGKGERRTQEKYRQFSQKMNEESENSIVENVAKTGGVGGIFLLKAVYGYRETSPLPPVEETAPLLESADAIREKHASAVLPEKPEL